MTLTEAWCLVMLLVSMWMDLRARRRLQRELEETRRIGLLLIEDNTALRLRERMRELYERERRAN